MNIRNEAWNANVEEKLKQALACDSALIREQVKRGISQLWCINDGESYMVTRREFDTLVIVAFEGQNLLDVAPYVINAARKHGCKEIRFHTTRPALIRLLHEYKPSPMEYVCMINLERLQ